MAEKVIAVVCTPQRVLADDIGFVIPSYQRAYVWQGDDVRTLLKDIREAQKSGQEHYYIGTILSKKQKLSNKCFELIDGQQRITTLILIAIAFHQMGCASLSNFAVRHGRPRLIFDIREHVQAFLGAKAGLPDVNCPDDKEIDNNEYLKYLNIALKSARQYLENVNKEGEGELADFASYINLSLKWVNNIIPEGLDPNRLFITSNTSGVQLEQSDILKSLLLKRIASQKPLYDAIWQACEHMGNYFERNLRHLFPESFKNHLIQYDDLAEFSDKFFISDSEKEVTSGLDISTLAKLTYPHLVEDDIVKRRKGTVTVQDPKEPNVYCRSIISFPLLLIHAYRVYRYSRGQDDFSQRVNACELSDIFSDLLSNGSENDVKQFFHYLWRVRYQFDRWVVKWVQQADETSEHLQLASVTLNDDRLSRSYEGTGNLSQLQSVRYFTGERSAQHWLTPFLGWLVKNKPSDVENVVAEMERIDNHLSLVLIRDKALKIEGQEHLVKSSQKIASFELLKGDCNHMGSVADIESYLSGINGAGFEHYWFQKLEYILWKQQKKIAFFKPHKLKHYRISSKNSVEHVHPQNEENGQVLNREYLDAFGNLALLSPGENSSYSNKFFGVKWQMFEGKGTYESLKLASIFHNYEKHKISVEDVPKDHLEQIKKAIIEHQKEMVLLINAHYEQVI